MTKKCQAGYDHICVVPMMNKYSTKTGLQFFIYKYIPKGKKPKGDKGHDGCCTPVLHTSPPPPRITLNTTVFLLDSIRLYITSVGPTPTLKSSTHILCGFIPHSNTSAAQLLKKVQATNHYIHLSFYMYLMSSRVKIIIQTLL